MGKITTKLGVLLFGLVGLANTSHAALNDLGNGLITDDTPLVGTPNGRTWMKDANLVNTACNATSGAERDLWGAFAILQPSLANKSLRNPTDICNDINYGTLNWYEAEAWIAVLNSQSYLGYDDWRQPITTQPDDSCSQLFVSANLPTYLEQRGAYNCTGSELSNLFNTSLGNPNNGDSSDCYDPPATAPNHCFQNTGPFDNAQSSVVSATDDFLYWSGGPYAPDSTFAWFLNTTIGYQGGGKRDVSFMFVWPVRSGQSVVPPAPVITNCTANDIGCISEAIKYKQSPFCNSITENGYGTFSIATPFGPIIETVNDGQSNDLDGFIRNICRFPR